MRHWFTLCGCAFCCRKQAEKERHDEQEARKQQALDDGQEAFDQGAVPSPWQFGGGDSKASDD
jgi:hypothetical protein